VKLQIIPGIRQGLFFDLEQTITADAVEQVASLELWRRRDVTTAQVLRVLWCYLRYNLGFISNFEELKAQGARVFTGREPERDAELLQELYERRLRQAIFPQARKLIEDAHAAQLQVAIISSTYRFMVTPFAAELKIDTFCGCELETREGRCTGQLQGRIPHQEVKATIVRELAEQWDLSLEHCYAFGDSLNDVPMLQAVGHPVVVNPGRRLRALASEQEWTIERWEKAGG